MRRRRPTTSGSATTAKGRGGVWQQNGGVEKAGEGVVVGVIDTGIAPEHPSFEGKKIKKQKKQHNRNKGAQPYTDGTYVYFDKSDGGQFQAAMVEGQDWDKSDYSSKLIGGQYFYAGAEAAGFDFQYDYLSPRDGDGHGSHREHRGGQLQGQGQHRERRFRHDLGSRARGEDLGLQGLLRRSRHDGDHG